MRIGITGANGFVGSALQASVGAAGWDAVCAVRTDSGDSGQSGSRRIIEDSLSADAWADVFGDVDCVVHLISRAHRIGEGSEAYGEYYRDNVLVSEALVDGLARTPVQKVIYVSSIKAVSERTEGVPIDDCTMPAPTTPYGRAKLEAEDRFVHWASNMSKDLVVLRPPLVYGPHVKGNFRSLLRIADSGVPLPIRGVENKRSMIYLDNLCDVILASASHDVGGIRHLPVTDADVLSTPEVVTVLRAGMGRGVGMFRFPERVLAAVSRALGVEERFRRISEDLVIDGSAAQANLGWNPRTTVVEGLVKTARWYAGRLSEDTSNPKKRAGMPPRPPRSTYQ